MGAGTAANGLTVAAAAATGAGAAGGRAAADPGGDTGSNAEADVIPIRPEP